LQQDPSDVLQIQENKMTMNRKAIIAVGFLLLAHPASAQSTKLPKCNDPQVLKLLDQAYRDGIKKIYSKTAIVPNEPADLDEYLAVTDKAQITFSAERLEVDAGTTKFCAADFVYNGHLPWSSGANGDQNIPAHYDGITKYSIQLTEDGKLYGVMN